MVVTIDRYKALYNQYFSPALDASSFNILKKKTVLQRTTQFLRRHNNIYTFKLKFSVINLAFQIDAQTAIVLS